MTNPKLIYPWMILVAELHPPKDPSMRLPEESAHFPCSLDIRTLCSPLQGLPQDVDSSGPRLQFRYTDFPTVARLSIICTPIIKKDWPCHRHQLPLPPSPIAVPRLHLEMRSGEGGSTVRISALAAAIP